MKQKLFAVRDAKTTLFGNPFCAITHADAQRSFVAGTNNPQSMVCQFPEDFALWHIGEYDQETGILTKFDQPVHMLNAIDLVKKETIQTSQPTAH